MLDTGNPQITEKLPIQVISLGQLKSSFIEISSGTQNAYETKEQIIAKTQELGLTGIRIVTNREMLESDEVMLIIGGNPPTLLKLTTDNQIIEVPLQE